MTNMLHRFTVQHKLKPALPRDNTFYGWGPVLESIKITKNVDPISPPPCQIMGSGHMRWKLDDIEKVVPGADYISILRSPVSHFVSSWNYWGLSNHIEKGGGPRKLGADDFLQNVPRYWHFMSESDRMLIFNGQMFDLGLDAPQWGGRGRKSAGIPLTRDNFVTVQQVRDHIRKLEQHFRFMLITDHYDESLVMLRRRMFWSLDDVVYMMLKSGKKKKKTVLKPANRAKLLEFNWADSMLFDHFNASLWRQIEAEGPDFWQEVTALRARNKELTEGCPSLNGITDIEKRHRLSNATKPLTALESWCYQAAMDSPDWSKWLKLREQGWNIRKWNVRCRVQTIAMMET